MVNAICDTGSISDCSDNYDILTQLGVGISATGLHGGLHNNWTWWKDMSQ